MLSTGDDLIKISDEIIEEQSLTEYVKDITAGAISTFLGTTRDTFKGKKVITLDYECYMAMALKVLHEICREVRLKYSLKRIAIQHRTGIVPIGDTSVIIAVSSVHRKDSLQACHYLIDILKERVPIWKKEVYENGEWSWKENHCC